MIESILNSNQLKTLYSNLELDFSYSIDDLSRFRGNILFQRNTIAVNFRVIPLEIPELDSLGLPAGIKDLCHQSRGLVLL